MSRKTYFAASAAFALMCANGGMGLAADAVKDTANPDCAATWAALDLDRNDTLTRDEDKTGYIEKANTEKASLVKAESMTRSEFMDFCSKNHASGSAAAANTGIVKAQPETVAPAIKPEVAKPDNPK